MNRKGAGVGEHGVDNRKAPPASLPTVIAVVVIVWVAFGIAVYFTFPDQETRGQFGDMFGAVNALFSALAFAILIHTLWLQREDLDIQRQELQDTREELKGQRKALETQSAHAAGQLAALQAQLKQSGKAYIERNKPVVFCDRVGLSTGGYEYVIRNVGEGFAVNVYFVPDRAAADAHGDWPVRAVGSLGPNSERSLPDELNRGLCDSGKYPFGFLIVAEGPYSRTTQWTPTLNYRSVDDSRMEGHVHHRVATIQNPSPRFERQPLREFLDQNAGDLLTQLATLSENRAD